MACINDIEMQDTMLNDIIERGYTHEDAMTWIQEHGESVIDEMWHAYSSYIENLSEYKIEEEV